MANLQRLASALASDRLVQSFSGVRAAFGLGPEISAELAMLASAYGYCYAKRCAPQGNVTLLLCRDPRPTGGAIVRAVARGFIAGGGNRVRLIELGIITTPLAETAVRALDADGGVMVTASHNPLDNNGFKFLTGCRAGSNEAPAGALLAATTMGSVISDVAALAAGSDADFNARLDSVSLEDVDKLLSGNGHEAARVKAERAYLDIIGEDWGITPHCLKPLTLGPVLIDPNGGAGCGIDARVLEHFGVRVIEVNAELGYPEHGIDTDGIDPASGRHMLLRVARAAARNGAHFGVAFDYDADRGNLVLPGSDESAIIAPQRVATFNIALALARRSLEPGEKKPLAVVCSDATSLASHRVARAFGAEIFQVETGEINVVSRMAELRREGYDVPVGVEGANGGTIFASATCRDGLQVALSAAQAESTPQIACRWLAVGNGAKECKFEAKTTVTLPELVESVPVNSNVMLKLTAPPMSHGEVKRGMEQYFQTRLWPNLSSRFDNYSFENFEETRMVDTRTGDQSGAWRVMLTGKDNEAFIFVRGSKTEPGVWRMIIDCQDASDFDGLVSSAKSMFASAI